MNTFNNGNSAGWGGDKAPNTFNSAGADNKFGLGNPITFNTNINSNQGSAMTEVSIIGIITEKMDAFIPYALGKNETAKLRDAIKSAPAYQTLYEQVLEAKQNKTAFIFETDKKDKDGNFKTVKLKNPDNMENIRPVAEKLLGTEKVAEMLSNSIKVDKKGTLPLYFVIKVVNPNETANSLSTVTADVNVGNNTRIMIVDKASLYRLNKSLFNTTCSKGIPLAIETGGVSRVVASLRWWASDNDIAKIRQATTPSAKISKMKIKFSDSTGQPTTLASVIAESAFPVAPLYKYLDTTQNLSNKEVISEDVTYVKALGITKKYARLKIVKKDNPNYNEQVEAQKVTYTEASKRFTADYIDEKMWKSLTEKASASDRNQARKNLEVYQNLMSTISI